MKKLLSSLLLFIGLPAFAQETIATIGTGEYATTYVTSTGSVYTPVGNDSGYSVVVIPSLTNIVQAEGGQYTSVLRSSAGKVYSVDGGTTTVTAYPLDNTGTPFSADYVQGFYKNFLALKNGELWYWSTPTTGRTSPADILKQGYLGTAPKKLIQPPGKSLIKIASGSSTSPGVDTFAWALASDGSIWRWDQTHTVPFLVTGYTGVARDIAMVGMNAFVVETTDNQLWAWGYLASYVGGNPAWQNPNPVNVTAKWTAAGAVFPSKKLIGSYNTLHIIDANNHLFGAGSNVQGAVGNGAQYPSWRTYTPTAYQWSLQNNQTVVAPVQIPGQWRDVLCNNTVVFYLYGQDMAGNWYSWGRNKSRVLGNGLTMTSSDESGPSEYYNIPAPRLVTPLTQTWKVSPKVDVNANRAPIASAGINQYLPAGTTTATLYGSGSHQQQPTAATTVTMSNVWSQVSGPVCTIVSPSSKNTVVNGLGAGTYVFKNTVTNSNAVSDFQQVTVVVGAPVVAVSATVPSAAEQGPTAGVFTVTRTGASTAALTVNLSISGTATSGTDYAPLAKTVSFLAGETSKTLTVTALNDLVVESNETVIVAIAAGTGYTFGTPSSATVTIADDDAASSTISIVATDPTAAEPGTDTGLFTINRTGVSTGALTVNLTVSGTATGGTDYTAVANTVSFLAGETSKIITVTALNDTVVESSESVTVAIASGTGYTIGTPASATVTIADDDATISIVATDSAAAEPGTKTGLFTVTRTGVSTGALTVNLTVSGTATSGTDYAALTNTVSFLAGETSKTITVTALNDTVVESNETVTVAIASGTGYAIGTPANATVTIADDDAAVSIVAADSTAAEPGTDTGLFTVSRTGVSTGALTVNLTVSGTATSGTDYTALTNTVSFLAGETSKTITVTALNDTVVESSESVTVAIASGTGYTIGTPASATVTIADDDAAISIVATDSAAAEPGTNTGLFTVNRTGVSAGALTVNLTVSGTATSGTDYAALTNTVSFLAGETSKTITVTALNDTVVESNETVTVAIASGTGYAIGTPASATVTIADDDAAISIVATDSAAAEPGTKTGLFTVNRTGVSTGALTVNLTVSGTATSGTDYTALANTVSFLAGETSKTITVTALNDTVVESSESVTVAIASGSGYAIGTPASATVTIADDDAAISIVATDSAAAEPGTKTGLFTVNRTGVSTGALTVNLTVSGTATSGTDYTALANTVSFLSGETSKTITVTALNDAVVESSESVTVAIAAGTGYAIGTPSSATVTIADDDATISIVATDSTVAEPGTDTGLFTVSRTGVSTGALTVNLTVSGTATSGTDYTALANTVSFLAGETSKTITVTALNDGVFESSESVTLAIASGSGYAIGTPASATVTIADDDATISIVATDSTAAEPGTNTGLFTVSRTGLSNGALTVNLTISGTATSGTDYTALTNTMSFLAGETSKMITVTALNDGVVESSESVTVAIASGTGYAIGTPASATVTIADDDAAISIVATDPTAAEPGTDRGLFTVNRTGVSTGAVTVNLTISGTATSGTDYAALANTVSFLAGETSKTITVTALNDGVVESNESVIVGIAAGSGYSVGAPASATVIIADNDGATAPTVSGIGAQSVFENSTTGALAFSVSDAETAAGSLVVSATSSDPTLLAVEKIVFGGSGSHRTVSLTPTSNRGGITNVTITAVDESGQVGKTTFVLTVRSVNSVPQFKGGGNQQAVMGAGLQTVPNWATEISPGAADEIDQKLSFTISVDHPEMFLTQPALSPNGTLTYKAVSSASGSAQVTVVLHDDGGTENGGINVSARQTFTLSVTSLQEEAGTYSGLVSAPVGEAPEHQKSGIVRIKMNRLGAFSGRLVVGGQFFALRGSFDGAGMARFGSAKVLALPLPRYGLPPLALTLNVDPSAGSDKMQGQLSLAGSPFASLQLDRELFTASLVPLAPLQNVPPELLGKYTVSFGAKSVADQGLAASEFPQGAGSASLRISTRGIVRLAGRLADGSAISGAYPLSKALTWPFYKSLNRGRGSILGTVSLRDVVGVSDLDGLDLNWFAPADAKRTRYPAGWPSGIRVDLEGSRYVVPLQGSGQSVFPGLSFADADGNLKVQLSEGGLPANSMLEAGNLSNVNRFSLPVASGHKLALRINPFTGLWTGSFVHPVTSVTTAFRGALLQKKALGVGAFLTPTDSGAVSLAGAGSQ